MAEESNGSRKHPIDYLTITILVVQAFIMFFQYDQQQSIVDIERKKNAVTMMNDFYKDIDPNGKSCIKFIAHTVSADEYSTLRKNKEFFKSRYGLGDETRAFLEKCDEDSTPDNINWVTIYKRAEKALNRYRSVFLAGHTGIADREIIKNYFQVLNPAKKSDPTLIVECGLFQGQEADNETLLFFKLGKENCANILDDADLKIKGSNKPKP
ncbi:MAG: hypothetical protein HQM04_05475 [Magnetococcales bacterium]|nr:hypothetical protein [Magnetococcales bacterium]MBF0114476.1 hypothetical protein [Magnetococcales bacterium]